MLLLTALVSEHWQTQHSRRLVKSLGALQVTLDGEQERVVPRELRQRSLRLVVEVVVPRQLRQERRHLTALRHRGHPQEDLLRLLALRDRPERFGVLEPVAEHAIRSTPRTRRRIRGYGAGDANR